ncbi:hypothetical protein V7S43_011623 [Phytophthora oleae]|uniref:SAP domain-containing protein n=1 Tax=Phytophthora oleae TaxID=2107226 RepID=A0ABD3F8N1_9STRA
MAERAESADERALRRELQELGKKREALNNSNRRGSAKATGSAAGRRSVFARLGGETPRGRQVVQLKENSARGNASRRLGKRDNEDNRESNAVKRQRLHSAVTRPEGAHSAEGRAVTAASSPVVNSARAQELKQRAVAPYAQKEGIARSRRMFGALMGHLGKAKRQIEKDTDLFKRQDTKQQEAEQREKKQSKNLEIQARHEAEIARLEALVSRTELDRGEQIARAKLEHLQMIRKSERQSKFLVTIASPPINYLPAKHTKETKELVAVTMEAHEAKVKSSQRTQEDKLRKLEAEFEIKLEQLRDELEAAKKGDKEDEQTSSSRKADEVEDGDEDMDQDTKEPQDKQEQLDNADNISNGSPKNSSMDIEAVGKDSGSGSGADDTSAVDGTSRKDGEKDDNFTVNSNSKSDEKVTSPRKANGSSAAHGDTEASSPNEKREKVEQATVESMSPKQNDHMDGSSVTEPDKATVDDEDRAMQEDNAAAVEVAVEPKEDLSVNVDKMKVTELRAELKKRGLDTKGLKAKLVQRLKQAIHEDDESK